MQFVLYAEDIYRFENATYHVETKNKSFIRYAVLLKEMGIQNSAFCLALLDRRLVDVDPFNPRNQDEMDWVSAECTRNPWYVLREILRIPEDSETSLIANRGLISFWWLFLNEVSIIHTQPRQTGKTLLTVTIKTWLGIFIYVSTTINVITLNENLRDETATKLKLMMSHLPAYLNQRTKRDTDVSEHIKIKAKGNTIRYWLPRSDVPNARNICRGSSGATLLGDEPPFQPNFSISWPAAQNSCNAEIKRLSKEGKPCGEAILTTAGVTTTPSGQFVYDLIGKSATFSEHLYDCKNKEDLHEVVKRSGRGVLRVYSEFNALQLGVSKEELTAMVLKNTGDDSQIAMELFNTWQTGDGTSPFSSDILERMTRSAKEPLYVEIDEKSRFAFNWYVPKEGLDEYLRTSSFVLTLDMAEGNSGDDISVTAIDISTLEVIGQGTINVVNTFVMTLWISKFFTRMPKMVFVPEAKSLGVAVIHFLLDYLPSIGENPFARIFNWVTNDNRTTHSNSERYRQAIRSSTSSMALREYQGEFGFKTSGSGRQARSELYNATLRDFAPIAVDGMNNIKLITQASRLESFNNRIDHRKGEHDDAVIGWVLGGWFLLYASNKDLYAIDADQVMRGVRMREISTRNPEEAHILQENARIVGLINAKLDQLRATQDRYVATTIEDEIRYLERKINNSIEGSTPLNIDEMLKQARDEANSRNQSSNNFGNTGNASRFFRPFF